jgi:DNA-binding CsgD family transcriptional regulator
MKREMGARKTLLLHPGCPPINDPGIKAVLELCVTVLDASWVELVVSWEGDETSASYEHGTAGGAKSSHVLEVGDEFSATLWLDGQSSPSRHLLRGLARNLEIALDCHMLRSQTVVLRAALDSTSISVLLFDSNGDIMYANSPADNLLSLQTEDELLVETEGHACVPLFSVLASVVDRVVRSDEDEPAWQGTLQSPGGRVLACEVTRLPKVEFLPGTVLVLLQYLVSEPARRLDAFCSTHNLSPREKEVVKLLVEGLTTTAMADRLGISPHTVRDHLKNLYRKTATRSRGELLGLVSRTAAGPTETHT